MTQEFQTYEYSRAAYTRYTLANPYESQLKATKCPFNAASLVNASTSKMGTNGRHDQLFQILALST